jgi:hypothetical protein
MDTGNDPFDSDALCACSDALCAGTGLRIQGSCTENMAERDQQMVPSALRL